MNYRLLPEARETVARATFVTGAMRTGTTMMMRLIASLDRVEMFHEPAVAYTLLPLIEDVPAAQWRLLFEACLFEDCFVPALMGHRLNLNAAAEAGVLHSKPRAEIDRRLQSRVRHAESVAQAHDHILAFKIPEMMPALPRLRAYYPDMRIIVMARRPEAVIASTVRRAYYSDEQLHGTPVKWPLQSRDDINLPFWLPETMVAAWCDMNEVARCCYAYVIQYQAVPPDPGLIVIDYDDFAWDPAARFAALSERVGWRYGPLTTGLLADVREPEGDRSVTWHGVDPDLRDRAAAAYEVWRHSATSAQEKRDVARA